jgi:FKBP-type peptidyl-prolyl cis-trans isomerase (trigger factor)|tara:strand:+ start:75 stop:293 length:219 start_codon:yes stop_codon:yes gene_type:complete
MKLTETQLDKLKDKFIDRFIADMDINQLKQYVRDDMNTYLARRNEEEVVNEMYGHLVDEDVVNKIITEVSSG